MLNPDPAQEQICAFSPEFVPYVSTNPTIGSSSMPFSRALLWNVLSTRESQVVEAGDGPRHRRGCLPLVLTIGCPAVGNLVLSRCSSIMQSPQQPVANGVRDSRELSMPSLAEMVQSYLQIEREQVSAEVSCLQGENTPAVSELSQYNDPEDLKSCASWSLFSY